jgi:hypothetical protein
VLVLVQMACKLHLDIQQHLYVCVQQHGIIHSNSLFFSSRPGALNALQGVIATLSSNYGQNNKLVFTGSSKWTLIATGGVTVVCAVLFIFYKFIILRNIQKKHDVEHGERRAGTHGEGADF